MKLKKILICLLSFLFVGCSIAGGAVLLSNSSYSDNTGGGRSPNLENSDDVSQNAPDNTDLWTASGNYATAFDNEGEAGIDGSTEEKAYEIRTAEQLALLAYRINTSSTNSTYSSLYYVQTADIDLSAHYWDAIGTSSYYFSGHYDGGGFTISGLYTQSGSSSTYSYQGLFGYVEGRSSSIRASIKNIGIIDSNIQGYRYVGGVVGCAYYFVTITNCYNTSSVTGNGYVGGVVGSIGTDGIIYDDVEMTSCYNYGNVTASSDYVGGIVGYAGDNGCDITGCYNYSSITGMDYVGGIAGSVGEPTGDRDGIGVVNCQNYGVITGERFVGGICGKYYYVYSMEPQSLCVFAMDKTLGDGIIGCDNYASVVGALCVGGICGSFESNEDLSNCYNAGNIKGSGNNVGGICGRLGSLFYGGVDIFDCANTGNILNNGGDYTGGVIGLFEGTTNVSRCSNSGDITVTSGNYVGGVIGGSTSSMYIYDSYNVGDFYGGNTVAGIIGNCYPYNIYLYNCYSVTENSLCDAGLVGKNFALGIYNCFHSGFYQQTGSHYGFALGSEGGTAYVYYFDDLNEVNNSSFDVDMQAAGGISGSYKECSVEDVRNSNWYTTTSNWNSSYPWDFENTWVIVEGVNNGFPVLRGSSIIMTYHSNFGDDEIVSRQYDLDAIVEFEGSELFEREGYNFLYWNTEANGGGLTFLPGDSYTGSVGLTLYAIWEEVRIFEITLDPNGGSGGTQEIWVKYGNGFYVNSSATGNSITSLTSLPTREGYTFNGFYTSATSGSRIIDSTGNIVVSNTFTTADVILYAQWVANNPAKYDSEGGYWYIENGKMPQKKVTDSTLISNINSSTTVGTTYYFAGLSLQSKVYDGKEYCQYNGNWYEVMPIRWRLVYSSSQTSGYGTTTDTLAVMAEIVYVDAFSDSFLGANAGYSSESVTELMKNQIDGTYLVSETKSMLTFGTTSLNGTPTSVTSNIFVASSEDISNFTTNASGTEKQGSINFSDLAKDFLLTNGKDTIYFTRDLGTNYNNIFCMNANGDRVQYKAQNYLGVLFTIKVTEYACV